MTTVSEHYGQDLGLLHYLKEEYQPNKFYCGIEYEIEDIKTYGTLENLFKIEVDPSLRNNGKEFKSFPAPIKYQLELFKYLHTTLKTGPVPFSERTSIHVHVNIKNFSLSKFRQYILTYALLEPLFFNYVGDQRKDNIYCVPLNYTYLPSYYHKAAPNLVDQWHKYTAFNIIPAKTFGTVEFRHMFGTNKYDVFSPWLVAIHDLWCYLNDSPETFSILKTIQEQKVWQIARDAIPTLVENLSRYEIETMLKDSLLDVKLASGGFNK